MHHHAQLIFVLLGEMGFYHVGLAGLKLLTSGDLPPPKVLGLQEPHLVYIFNFAIILGTHCSNK